MPEVFLSYRQTSDTERHRVRAFAERLRSNGIRVILDQFFLEVLRGQSQITDIGQLSWSARWAAGWTLGRIWWRQLAVKVRSYLLRVIGKRDGLTIEDC